MSKLNFIHICESAFTTRETGNLNIIGIFDGIKTRGFPAVHPKLSIVFSISADIGEHQTTLLIKTKNSKREIGKFVTEFNIPQPDGKYQTILNLSPFSIPEEDDYVFEVLMDEKFIGATTIKASKA